MSVAEETLYDLAGGASSLLKICALFYDKIYADPWLCQYFADISQEHIEKQQATFMSGVLGGPKVFSGRLPVIAHEHMHISDELFDRRNRFLVEALNEAGTSEAVTTAWLNVDNSFRAAIVKTMDQCKKRYYTDVILDVAKPVACR